MFTKFTIDNILCDHSLEKSSNPDTKRNLDGGSGRTLPAKKLKLASGVDFPKSSYHVETAPSPPEQSASIFIASIAKKKKVRTCFTRIQLDGLEAAYARQRYLPAKERTQLSHFLGLTCQQVKTWFQNRRMKDKRLCFGETSSFAANQAAAFATYSAHMIQLMNRFPTGNDQPKDKLVVFAPWAQVPQDEKENVSASVVSAANGASQHMPPSCVPTGSTCGVFVPCVSTGQFMTTDRLRS